MDIHGLAETPSWEWPEDAGEIIAGVLSNASASSADLLAAAELAGDLVVVSDVLAAALLSMLVNPEAQVDLRGRAAISLGPVLEYVSTGGLEEPEDAPISEEMYEEIREVLHTVYSDEDAPRDVRRRALEAAVRAPDDWHEEAVRGAYASGDGAWRLTAVFCMCYIGAFEKEIIESLESDDEDVRYEALCAAAAWGVPEAWPRVEEILGSADPEKRLLLAAIEAVGTIRPSDAPDLLGDLSESEDEEIAEAAHEAITMAEAGWGDGEDGGDETYDDEK